MVAIIGALLSVATALAQPASLPPRPSPAVESLVGEYGEGGTRLVLREAKGALEVSPDGRAFEPVRELGGAGYEAARIGEFRIDRGVPKVKTKGVGVQSVVQGISIGSVFLPDRKSVV